MPETFNMTRSLSAAFAIAFVGAGSSILLQCLADPARLNWWHWWNTGLDPNTDPTVITNGQVGRPGADAPRASAAAAPPSGRHPAPRRPPPPPLL